MFNVLYCMKCTFVNVCDVHADETWFMLLYLVFMCMCSMCMCCMLLYAVYCKISIRC